jgi:predicted transcriptional regulator of viral defense system
MLAAGNCRAQRNAASSQMKPSFQFATQIIREHSGIMRASQARRLGIDPKTLSSMVADGLLIKETRGIYRLAGLPPLANPDLVQAAIRVPQGVVCLISALSFHDLTTQIPHQVHLALPRGAYAPRIEYPPVAITWFSQKSFQAGIEKHSLDGLNVHIYSREKTIADCFKFRNKIGLDVALEGLKAYLALPGRDIDALLRYAKVNRVANVMHPYLQAAA